MNTYTQPITVRFVAAEYDLSALAATLTELKALTSRTPTPVTTEQLMAIDSAKEVAILLLQKQDDTVVGMVHLCINHLEDRAHLGPIAVNKPAGGWGTPLMEDAIAFVKDSFPLLRRIDLTNRPDHDLGAWYQKFGFQPRTEATGDPTTVYRLNIG